VPNTQSGWKQVGLFPCRGSGVPCRTLSLVSATCIGTVKPGFTAHFPAVYAAPVGVAAMRRATRYRPATAFAGPGLSPARLFPKLSWSFQKHANVFPPDRSLAVAARNEAAYRAATARERYLTHPQKYVTVIPKRCP